ncbi:hypothetical protein BGZ82_009617 [Podila clonocystis]|nr:hypothetical protein BGZ82_009617 [Podila clonocystis]
MENILLVGSTGVGKTSILNVFRAPLKSGFALVNELTSGTTYCEVDIDGKKVRLIDAPGLIEYSTERIDEDAAEYSKNRIFENATELSKAMRFSGKYKIVFVYQSFGRRGLMPHDVYTTAMVCMAINHCLEVGLIINKVKEEDMMIYDNQEDRLLIAQALSKATNGKLSESRIIALEYCKESDRHYARLLRYINILLS